MIMNTQRNRNTQMMPRRRRGQNPSIQGVLDLSARQVNGPNDPPAIPTTLIHTVRVSLPVGSTDTTGGITPTKLIAAIPGGTGYWKFVRLVRASIWGTKGLLVDLIATDNNRRFADVGVPGSRSSVVHMSLPLLTRANWYSSTSATVLAQWGTTPANGAVVHCTIEVTS